MARDPIDPTGVIRESFRIEGITLAECRTIFFNWALGVDEDMQSAVRMLLQRYADMPYDHPMLAVLTEAKGTQHAPKRRGGRRARVLD